MTSTNDKIRALFLTALMVLSVVAMTTAFAGTAAAGHDGDDTEWDAVLGARTHWVGQVAIHNDTQIDAGDVYEIRDPDGNTIRERVAQDAGHVLVPTSGLETGTYTLNWTDANASTPQEFRVAVQDLDVEFSSSTVTAGDVADLEIDSNRGEFTVSISADGLDEDDLLDIINNSVAGAEADDGAVEVTALGGGTLEANFTGVAPGDYTFDVSVTDTDAEASADVTVSSLDVSQDFSQSVYEEEAGDIAEITVELEDTSSVYIFVGGDESGWIGGVHAVDDDEDGEVTVTFNSYLAGMDEDNSDVFSVAGDDVLGADGTLNRSDLNASADDGAGFADSYDANTNLTEPVEAGDYDLRAASTLEMNADGSLVNENDVGTLILGERSTDGVTIHTAPAGAEDTDDEVEELLDAVTETDTLALNDRLVVEVEASGIYGYLADNGTDALVDGTGTEPVTFDIVQFNEGPNRDPATMDLTANTEIILDSENNRFFVVVDTRNVDADLRDVAAGQDWRARLIVGDDAAPNYANYVTGEDQEVVSADLSFESPTGSFDNLNADGDLQILQDSAAAVSGTSNLAPGTELNVRLRASGDSPFLKTATAVVESDGTWSVEFDTSDTSIGQEFEAQLRHGSDTLADPGGIVVEQIGTVTPTASPTPSPTPTASPTPPPTTAPPTTMAPSPTPTTADQPGFGIAVAILAILGAALLAVRRRD